ncbi:MAG: S26 family signal peptidase [Thermoplasmata archaeon]
MAEEEGRRLPQGVINLLRDLAIAFLLVAVVMAALFAFARVWPPMVVVESSSMQHSNSESALGVIDTGDIVLVQNAPRPQDITTWVEGKVDGHTTYGDYGDVIIFKRAGREAETPVIHRAMMFIIWNDSAMGFDIPSLLALDPEFWDSNQAEPMGLSTGDHITLKDVGFKKLAVRFNMGDFVGRVPSPEICPRPCGGYITMGDNNAPTLTTDDRFVRQELVLGRARGELPWFGLLKLVLGGDFGWGDSRAPANSWTSLTIALVLLIVAPLALDVIVSRLVSRKSRGGSNPGDGEPK